MLVEKIKVQSKLIRDYTNCYILYDKQEAMCIDPGGDAEKIAERIENLGIKLKYIYLTHSHADHTQCVEELRCKCGGKVLISRLGAENINKSRINMSVLIHEDININIDARVDEGDIIHIGDSELKVINTPGHTNDGTSIYSEENEFIITGDTLMQGTYGRCDLPTGNEAEIKTSLEKLFELPSNTIIYPGHGDSTIMFIERDNFGEFVQA